MRSAPTLKIWMTPFASVAMLEKLALLKMAACSAPVSSNTFVRGPALPTFVDSILPPGAPSGPALGLAITSPRQRQVVLHRPCGRRRDFQGERGTVLPTGRG